MGDADLRLRRAAMAGMFAFLAHTYLTQTNYYVRTQFTELALAALLGIFMFGLLNRKTG